MFRTADRHEVQRLMDGGAQVVEVLGASEYNAEHLPGAVNIPLSKIREGAESLDRNRPVVVYCYDYQ